ncbi:MAG: hypothetical protein AAF182_03525 [Pseudomonadota bacterium]
MLEFLETLNGPKASAKVVDGKLVLSLPNALKPTVWQMNFEQYAASSLEVDGKGESFLLLMKTPDGKSVEIAPFSKREDAVKALVVASKALEQGPGGHFGSGVNLKKWVTPVLAILFLYFLLSVWASLGPIEPSSVQSSGFAAQGGAAQTGVPMSADAFLNAQ